MIEKLNLKGDVVRDIHAEYQRQVVIPEDEWIGILYDLKELDQLRKLCDERDNRDREYLNWSLSTDRMVEALDLARAVYVPEPPIS